nr:unnamed protein product [Digitaria exilis]
MAPMTEDGQEFDATRRDATRSGGREGLGIGSAARPGEMGLVWRCLARSAGGGGCGGPGGRRGEFGWDKAEEEGDDEERRPSSGGGGGIRWLPSGDI